jgi:hypothetical protein
MIQRAGARRTGKLGGNVASQSHEPFGNQIMNVGSVLLTSAAPEQEQPPFENLIYGP